MGPQVVGFREFLWKSARKGLSALFLLRRSRPDVLIERVFRSGGE